MALQKGTSIAGPSDNGCVNLLWTSGWDSTFRLVTLVAEGRQVQPLYALDRGRGSWSVELATQEKIRDAIGSDLIKPTIVMDLSEVPEIPEITAAYEVLSKRFFIGPQYDWLSRMAHHLNLSGLELSVHVDDRLHHHLDGYVVGDRLSRDAPPELALLFNRFRFPILNLTKLDMQAQARKLGFEEVMEMTWFCFTPVRSQPCGTCPPCRFTIGEGLARRIPFQGRMKGRSLRAWIGLKKMVKRPVKRLLSRSTKAASERHG